MGGRSSGQGGDMDIPAMFRGAVAEFDARVRQIGDHQWQAATPDEDWSVRDLVRGGGGRLPQRGRDRGAAAGAR